MPTLEEILSGLAPVGVPPVAVQSVADALLRKATAQGDPAAYDAALAVGPGMTPQGQLQFKTNARRLGYSDDFGAGPSVMPTGIDDKVDPGRAIDPIAGVAQALAAKRAPGTLGEQDVYRQRPDDTVPLPTGNPVALKRLAETVPANPLGGVATGPDKSLTEQQAKTIQFVDRAAAAMPVIEQYGKSLTDPVSHLKAGVPFFGNAMKDDDYRKAELAGEVFIMSILRPDTGATITDNEMSRYTKTFLPQPFDTQTQLDMKSEFRRTAIQGMQLGLPKDAIMSLVTNGIKLVGPNGASPAAAPAPQPNAALKSKYGLE